MNVIVGSEFPIKVIPLIDGAKHKIDVVVFDWRWYPNDMASSVQLFNQAFVRAVRRGVAIRAISNSQEIVDILNGVGISARKLRTPDLVHCKLINIDDSFSVMGSHNYSNSAFTKNFELSMICDNPDDISRFLSFFDSIWGQ
jgi:phosphatidylserine/phosphatidylglycerophosphate/cardiolipin synthase-like enzyme